MKFKIYEDNTGGDARVLDLDESDHELRIGFHETSELCAVGAGWDTETAALVYRLTPWYAKHWVASSKYEDVLELIRNRTLDDELIDIDTLGRTAATPSDVQLNQKRLVAVREAAAILNDPHKATDIIALADYLQGNEA